MPNIKLTDRLGFEIDAEINPDSSIAKYINQLTKFKFPKLDLAEIQNSTLDEAPLKSLDTGISFEQPIGIGVDDTKLTIGAGVSGNMKLLTAKDKQLFDPEVFGDPIAIADNEAYVGLSTTATLSTGLAHETGNLSFGFNAGSKATLSTFLLFEKTAGTGAFPKFVDALKETLSGFTIPGDLDDLKKMPVRAVATVEGSGSLKFSGSVNVLSVVNPLATVDLPAPIGAVNVTSGNAIKVGAAVEISGAYQVRAQKLGSNNVRLGYYKRRGKEFTLKVSASGGLSAGPGDFDAITPLLKAISSDPALDIEELKKGGLSQAQIEAIKKTLEDGLSRKLEVALGFELSSKRTDEAAFLFDIEINKLNEGGRKALANALDGDLSELAKQEQLPAGISLVRSILTEVQKKQHALKFNLLGIYNFISVSKLVLSGTVLFEKTTGDVIITDKATASRIAASTANFATNTKKLRKVLAESVLITAVYRCSKLVAQQPELKIAHSYFELHGNTDRTKMKNNLDVFESLGLITASEKEGLLGTAKQFGRTTFYVDTAYTDAVVNELFLKVGQPRAQTEYENAGRKAMALVVQPGDDDHRRLPVTDPVLWKEMTSKGQPGFKTIPKLKSLSADKLGAITTDFSVIIWWAESMAGMSKKLAAVRQFIKTNPGANPEDDTFKTLREDLAKKLKDVASKTKNEFGDPWGLVAMDQCSGQKAAAQALITGPQLAIFRTR